MVQTKEKQTSWPKRMCLLLLGENHGHASKASQEGAQDNRLGFSDYPTRLERMRRWKLMIIY
jgi:hypothetical protein